jgi:NAD kinase
MQSLILNPVMPIDMLPAIVIPPAKVNISCNDSLYVILDGQVSYEVKPGEKVHIYRGDDLTLVKLSRTSLHQFSRIFK